MRRRIRRIWSVLVPVPRDSQNAVYGPAPPQRVNLSFVEDVTRPNYFSTPEKSRTLAINMFAVSSVQSADSRAGPIKDRCILPTCVLQLCSVLLLHVIPFHYVGNDMSLRVTSSAFSNGGRPVSET